MPVWCSFYFVWKQCCCHRVVSRAKHRDVCRWWVIQHMLLKQVAPRFIPRSKNARRAAEIAALSPGWPSIRSRTAPSHSPLSSLAPTLHHMNNPVARISHRIRCQEFGTLSCAPLQSMFVVACLFTLHLPSEFLFCRRNEKLSFVQQIAAHCRKLGGRNLPRGCRFGLPNYKTPQDAYYRKQSGCRTAPNVTVCGSAGPCGQKDRG